MNPRFLAWKLGSCWYYKVKYGAQLFGNENNEFGDGVTTFSRRQIYCFGA